jgi:hypothetical protein
VEIKAVMRARGVSHVVQCFLSKLKGLSSNRSTAKKKKKKKKRFKVMRERGIMEQARPWDILCGLES